MNKHIVTLSDTSHPFTTIQAETDKSDNSVKWERSWQNDPKHNTEPETDNSDETDNAPRTVTMAEFAAIRAFKSKWGYTGNAAMTRELVGMLQNDTTDTNTLINRFMRAWDLYGTDYTQVQHDLQNLFIVRIVTENPTLAAESTIPTFTPEEQESLKSLEGEKSDKWTEKPLTLSEYNKAGKSTETLRKELFREEADKRVNRYFIGQTGWAWYVHFIVDMPESFAEIDPYLAKSLYQAKDGRTTLHMTSIYKTEQDAWNRINDDIKLNTSYDDGSLTHVVELDKM